MRFERKPVWPTSCMPGIGKEFLNQNPWCCVAAATKTCLDLLPDSQCPGKVHSPQF